MPRLRQLIHEIHRRSLWQVLTVYVAASFGVLSVIDTLGGALNLPEGFDSMALALLVLGLPIVIATAFIAGGTSPRAEGVEEAETSATTNAVGVGTRAGAVAADGSGRWRRLAVTFAALFILAAGATGWSMLRPDPPRTLARFALAVPDGLESGSVRAISNDGGTLALRGTPPGGEPRLYLRELNRLSATPVPGTEGVGTQVTFSPDGRAVAFTVGNSLRMISLDSTDPVTLVGDSVDVNGITWASDGMVYFRKRGARGVWRVPARGGGPAEEVTPLPAEFFEVLPDARALVLTLPGVFWYEISIASLETGEVRTLSDLGEAVCMVRYAHSGHLIYTDCLGNLLAVPFDLERLEVTGPSETILGAVWTSRPGFSRLALSQSGVLVYRSGEVVAQASEGVPVWLAFDGSVEVVDSAFVGDIEAVAISPDGRRVAYDLTVGGRTDIWVYDLASRTSSRLTFEGSRNNRPAWSADGSEVGFVSDRSGTLAFHARPWDGSGPARLLRSPSEQGMVIREALWTPDGQWLVYREVRTNPDQDILYAAPHPDSAVYEFLDDPFTNTRYSLSPNGRWLAYSSNESGQFEVYVRPFPGPGGRFKVSEDGGGSPIWAPDGRRILYLAQDSWVIATVRTEPDFLVAERERFASAEGFTASNVIQSFDVGSDGRVMAIRASDEVAQRDIVVLDLFEQLRRMVPN